MKKSLLIIIAGLIFANTNTMFAQQNVQQRPYIQIKQYINKNVLPFIKTQKESLTASLNENEKEVLKNIENDLEAFRNQGKQIRESMKGNYNESMAELRKKSFNAIIARADSLLANHPGAVSAYKKAYSAEKEKWEKDLADIMPNRNGAPAKRGIIPRLENPSYALLWNENNNFWHYGQKNMRHAARKGMKNRMFTPETKEKIRKYAETNIIPVIEKEQKEFEKTLSKKELKKIEEARQLIAKRKDAVFAMWNDNGSRFQTGDSARLAMQIEMQKAMLPVREIALKHYNEIEKHISAIKENIPHWREEIMSIVSENTRFNKTNAKMPPFIHNKIKRINRPEAFLIFDKSVFERYAPANNSK